MLIIVSKHIIHYFLFSIYLYCMSKYILLRCNYFYYTCYHYGRKINDCNELSHSLKYFSDYDSMSTNRYFIIITVLRAKNSYIPLFRDVIV